MAENKTILDLNEVTANASGDTFVVVQNGVTQKTTLSKIKTFFDAIYTTTSAVATQISSALANYVTNTTFNNTLSSYATQTFANNAANTAQSNANSYTDQEVATRIEKQSTTKIGIDASSLDASIGVSNCVLSITNIPSGTGNKTISIKINEGAFTEDDIITTSVLYNGFDINLRSWVLIDEVGTLYLRLFINVHSSPTEPILIAINKIN